MNWLPVPRSTMDALVRANDALSSGLTQLISERDWLRAQLASALDHNRRLERTEAKLHEVPTVPKPTRTIMPREVRDAIDAWEDDSTRARLEADAYKLYDKTSDWTVVLAALSDGA